MDPVESKNQAIPLLGLISGPLHNEAPTLTRWIRDRALTLALLALFVVSLVGQLISGFHEYNATQQEHGLASVGPREYFRHRRSLGGTF
jgi:hypothetical protein